MKFGAFSLHNSSVLVDNAVRGSHPLDFRRGKFFRMFSVGFKLFSWQILGTEEKPCKIPHQLHPKALTMMVWMSHLGPSLLYLGRYAQIMTSAQGKASLSSQFPSSRNFIGKLAEERKKVAISGKVSSTRKASFVSEENVVMLGFLKKGL